MKTTTSFGKLKVPWISMSASHHIQQNIYTVTNLQLKSLHVELSKVSRQSTYIFVRMWLLESFSHDGFSPMHEEKFLIKILECGQTWEEKIFLSSSSLYHE